MVPNAPRELLRVVRACSRRASRVAVNEASSKSGMTNGAADAAERLKPSWIVATAARSPGSSALTTTRAASAT